MSKKLISYGVIPLLSISFIGCSNIENTDKSNNDKITTIISSSGENDNTKPKENSVNKENLPKIDISNLDNITISWFFKRNDTHTTPDINEDLKFNLNDYAAIYNGETNKDFKSLYLTFDEGYENGYTSKILDVLKEKNTKAVFFVTSPYIRDNPDLIKRMVNEGHIVGNHSNTHPSMPDKTDSLDIFDEELTDVENQYKELTGKEMIKLFRPPMGKYSEKSLAMTKNLGYKSVFWSFAYHDWDPNKQPSNEDAKKRILENLHDGSILLLHAVSKTNTEILGDFIDSAQKLGYQFELLH